MTTFGQRLRAARLEACLTQTALGKAVGIQKSAISKYERDAVSGVTIDVVHRLAEALSIPPSDLYMVEEPDEPTAPDPDTTGVSPLGKRIMYRREWLRMSQSELALKVGLTDRADISEIETGANRVPVDKVRVFAEALRVPVSELLDCNNAEWATFCKVWKLLNE